MNLGRVGGLLEAKKIAGMAEAHHVQIAPHLYCGPVVGAANVQLAACSPNFPDPREHRALAGFPRRDPEEADPMAGRLCDPTDAAGLGVELNEEFALRHPYKGDKLHLEMHPGPVV